MCCFLRPELNMLCLDTTPQNPLRLHCSCHVCSAPGGELRTGNRPRSVSAPSSSASTPSRTAFATSVASALREFVSHIAIRQHVV